MSDQIHQEIRFESDPDSVYRALTDQMEFSALTNSDATIGSEPGDSFSAFGGMITGRQIDLVPGRRIVQAWRAGTWPEGRYAINTFELEPDGSETRLTFRQAGFPEGEQEHLSDGWHKMYWEPLKAHLRVDAPAG
jgi:activator of HSP90 ATPase